MNGISWATIVYLLHIYLSRQERVINNEEEEGKGRSAKRPRERLKFQIFPTVVALLSLEQWRNAHGANRPDARRVSNFYNGHEKLVMPGRLCGARLQTERSSSIARSF